MREGRSTPRRAVAVGPQQPPNPRHRTPLGILHLGLNEASSKTALGEGRAGFTETLEPIVGDTLATRELRAEQRFDVQLSPGVGSEAEPP